MTLNDNLKTKTKRYWKIKKIEKSKKTFIQIKSDLKKILIKSIELRLRSDVPIALCLSGGIDSTLIASVAKKNLKKP